MPTAPVDTGGALRLWREVGQARVHWHYHLSAYGKFEAGKVAQLGAIGELARVDALHR